MKKQLFQHDPNLSLKYEFHFAVWWYDGHNDSYNGGVTLWRKFSHQKKLLNN